MTSCILCDEGPVSWPTQDLKNIPYLIYDDISITRTPLCSYHLDMALKKCRYLDKALSQRGVVYTDIKNYNQDVFKEQGLLDKISKLENDLVDFGVKNRTFVDECLQVPEITNWEIQGEILKYLGLMNYKDDPEIYDMIHNVCVDDEGVIYIDRAEIRITKFAHTFKISAFLFNDWLVTTAKKLAKEYESCGFVPPRCKAIKKNGRRCWFRCRDGGDYCRVHKTNCKWHNPKTLKEKQRLDRKLELVAKILTDEIPMENVKID